MDTDRFAQLSRLLSSALPTRREILIGLLGTGSVAVAAIGADAASKEQKRRRRRRRRNRIIIDPPPPPPPPNVCPPAEVCGPGCCTSEYCFAKTVNPNDSTQVEYDCCPAGNVCKSVKAGYPDQCCYVQEFGEYCDPQLPQPDNLLGVCCRPCNGVCLTSDQYCNNGVAEDLNTARLPRYRR